MVFIVFKIDNRLDIRFIDKSNMFNNIGSSYLFSVRQINFDH